MYSIIPHKLAKILNLFETEKTIFYQIFQVQCSNISPIFKQFLSSSLFTYEYKNDMFYSFNIDLTIDNSVCPICTWFIRFRTNVKFIVPEYSH